MKTDEVEAYLHEHIPLSAAMGVGVAQCDSTQVLLTAPLDPNINHRQTAFGGSVSALAILAAWTMIHFRLRSEGIENVRLVIQRNSVEYLAPATAMLEAHCPSPSDADWQRFVTAFQRRGRARLTVTSEVHSAGVVAATFTGDYVALGT